MTTTTETTQAEQLAATRGVDRRDEDRPGVPMELRPPRPLDGAHWDQPEPQPVHGRLTKRAELERMTPVFGTAQPPSGVSGALREAAYRIPEHRARHWMLLLLADRVDVLEHATPSRARWLPLAIPLAVPLLFAVGRRRRKTWVERLRGR